MYTYLYICICMYACVWLKNMYLNQVRAVVIDVFYSGDAPS